MLDGLIYGAFREAAALGHTWIGAEHYLLAILAMKVESPTVAALAHLGVRHDEFASDLATAIAASDPPINDASTEAQGVTLNPAAHEFLGRAEGIAVGLGAPAVTLEHVLMAYLWETSHSYGSLEGFGLTPQAVLEELERRGVAVPTASLPPPPRPSTQVFVPFEAADEMWTRLYDRLPRDSGLGINHHEESRRAWVVADQDIDLESHVRSILKELGINEDST
jgi:ATP-dependent Clp protease ATP-binding subunit ClpA